jgi:hypothetical protein
MSTASHLVDWAYPIMKASSRDRQRFGPNAARIRALLCTIDRLPNQPSATVSRAYWRNRNELLDATRQLNDVIRNSDRADLRHNVANSVIIATRPSFGQDAARRQGWLGYSAKTAANAELVSDLIDPEIYRIATSPLAAGNALERTTNELWRPGLSSEFIHMVEKLSPASIEDVLALERLAQNPNAQGLMQILGDGLVGENQPLARRIRAAEMLWKSGRRGKGML